ncbi:unnamed protein product, partial [Symbiodinium natans]
MKSCLLLSSSSGVSALEVLCKHRHGNIIMSGWRSLASGPFEELADREFGGKTEDVLEITSN